MSRFGRLRTTEDVFFYRLGAALTMELTVLDLLRRLKAGGTDHDLWTVYDDRAQDAQRHITNIEAAFRLAGKEPWERPCPAIDGLIKDGQIALRKAHRSLVDSVMLTAAREVVAYGIATYETLLDAAEAMGAHDVIVLLSENLDEQRQSSHIVNAFARRVAAAATLPA